MTLPPDLAPRAIIGVAGLLLLLAGSRVWRVAVVAPGIIGGAAGGGWIGARLALPPAWIAGLSAVGALLGALLAALVERAAMVVAGILGGIGAVAAAERLIALPWWAWPLGALVGALTFPAVWRGALVPLTAWIGAVALGHTFGHAEPWVVLPLMAVGVFAQVRGDARRDSG